MSECKYSKTCGNFRENSVTCKGVEEQSYCGIYNDRNNQPGVSLWARIKVLLRK